MGSGCSDGVCGLGCGVYIGIRVEGSRYRVLRD